MDKKNLFARISFGLILTGLIGFSVIVGLDWLRPKTGLRAELEQTKKMLRQGFDKNRALVKENTEFNEKLVRLLQEVEEGKKNEESLRKQLQGHLDSMRKLTKEKDRAYRAQDVLRQVNERYHRLLEQVRGQMRAWPGQVEQEGKPQTEELQEARKVIHTLTSEAQQREKFVVELGSRIDFLRTAIDQSRKEWAGLRGKLNSALEEKNRKIAELEEEKEKSKGARPLLGTPSLEKGPGPVSPSDIHELRREIAQEYLGTIEDLLARIDQLKGGKPKGARPLFKEEAPEKEPGPISPSRFHELEQTLEKEKALRKKDRLTFFYNLGVTYTHYGLVNEAVSIYEKALEIDPSDASTHYNLGILYDEHLGKKREAVEHYQKFLELEPRSKKRREVENWIRLARTLGEGERGGRARSAKGAVENMFLTSAS